MASMLSLLDVLPRHERVDIGGGQEVDVFGISGEDIGKILARYPGALQQLMGRQPAGMDPSVLGALLAAAQRNGKEESLLGNEELERRCRSLSVGAQMKMLQAVGRSTFPDGVGPFLESLMAFTSAANQVVRMVTPPASRAQPTELPPTPKPSESPDIPASGS